MVWKRQILDVGGALVVVSFFYINSDGTVVNNKTENKQKQSKGINTLTFCVPKFMSTCLHIIKKCNLY